MARYIVVAFLASSPVTYLYEDPSKALAQVRTLERLSTGFEVRDGVTNALVTVEELEERLRQS